MEKRVVIYTRVSDPSQIDNNSLETQEDICKRFAEAKGYQISKIFREEGESAKHVHTRPQLMELVKYCSDKKNGVSCLVVYKIDRLSRNMAEGLQLITSLMAMNVFVYSATEQFSSDAAGTFLKNVLMAAAQYDNETKGEKVRDNMQAVFRDGLWPFKCPIGYRRQFKTKEENKGLVVVPHSDLAPIVKNMFKNAATGLFTKSQLAKMMNAEGFGNHYHTSADHKIVRNMLSKSFYYSNNYAPKWDEYAEGKQEPLTDRITWEKSYNYLILKKKNYHFQDEALYPLKGVLSCEYCNHPLTTSPSKGGKGIVYYYECRYKDCNRKVRINAQNAHDQFEALLAQIQPTSRVTKIFENMVFNEWDQVINETQSTAKKIEKHIEELKLEIKKIRKAKEDGIYTIEEAKADAERVRQELVVSEIEKSEVTIEHYDHKIVREFTTQFLNNLTLLWNDLDLPKRQTFLQKVFDGKLICDEGRKIRTLKLSPSFELIQTLRDKNVNLVTPLGFEPRICWMKTNRPSPLDDGAAPRILSF